jgi:hypothetical protein
MVYLVDERDLACGYSCEYYRRLGTNLCEHIKTASRNFCDEHPMDVLDLI